MQAPILDLISQYLDKTFDERERIFQKEFECVDIALNTGNIDMLSISLNSITQSSPFKALSDISSVKKMLASGELLDI